MQIFGLHSRTSGVRADLKENDLYSKRSELSGFVGSWNLDGEKGPLNHIRSSKQKGAY